MSAAVRPAYHLSKRELKSWGDFGFGNEQSRAKVGAKGKPIGLWYAYDTTWANTMTPQGFNVGKYKYLLPLGTFTTDPSTPDHSAILRLNEENFEEFLEKYHKKEYVTSPREKLANLIYQFHAFADDSILDVFSDSDELKERIEEVDYDPDEIVRQKILAVPTNGANKNKIFVNGRALSEDEMAGIVQDMVDAADEPEEPFVMYTWPQFWKSVAEDFAGVEFEASLVKARNAPRNIRDLDGNSVEVSWLRLLDVVSGCIFNPETYFGGEQPPSLLVRNSNSGTAAAGAAAGAATGTRGGRRKRKTRRSTASRTRKSGRFGGLRSPVTGLRAR
jgi:hypothetical protein